MRSAFAILLLACSSPEPARPLSHVDATPSLSFCIERETPCNRDVHTEQINGKQVTVVGALDCVGPRHVECAFADGRREMVAGQATDPAGLGGGRYRYLTWEGMSPTLVTVDGGRHRREAGGAARTYGPFGPYGLTAQSLDGRFAAVPELDDETLTAVTVRDTIRGAAIERLALTAPIPVNRERRVLMSRDGKRVGVCEATRDRLVLHLADRTLPLPGTRCIGADDELAQVLVRVARSTIDVVEIATGRRTSLDASDAAFAGRDAVVIVQRKWLARGVADGNDRVAYVRLPESVTRLGEVPFAVDTIRVAADGLSVIVFREGANTPPRAYAMRLPAGAGYEIPLPPDTVDITVVPE